MNIQKLVRFCADYRIKPHAPPLIVGPRQFLWVPTLRLYSSGGMLNALTVKPKKIFLSLSIHNLQYRLPGYLILFAPYTFVPQCQFLLKSCLRYWYSFMLSSVITLKHKILLFCTKLKYGSIKRNSKVEL